MFKESSKKLFGTHPILFFSLIMLLKSSIAWLVIFENGVSWTTLLKELPFVLVFYCLIEAFSKKRKLLYYLIANLLMTSILFAVIMYYKYYGVIVTYMALQQVNQVTAVKNSVFSLMDPYFLLIFIDIVIMAVLLFKAKGKNLGKGSKNTSYRKAYVGLAIVCVLICTFNILPNHASMNEIVKAEQMGILNYEAYTILANKDTELVEPEQINQETIYSIKDISMNESPILNGSAKGKNLIIIQMESFQNFLVNLHVGGQEITPNFNKLVNDHYYFSHFYQQVGQGNTSDAEFVVNTSLYVPKQGAAAQMYTDYELPSLPKLLESYGYDSATFHTNVVEFWNRGELYQAIGFNQYYDAEFFGEEDTVFFGASDEVLYDKTAKKLEEMNASEQPFYAQVISMTAHHPFTMPEEKQMISLPEEYKNTMVGDYLISQNYADKALGEFIDQLKQSGVWEDSLIVLYGDHLGLPIYSLDNNELKLMADFYGREYTYKDMINVPLVIVNEGVTEPKVIQEIGGQVDIMPTVSNLLGVNYLNQIHFGQDLLNQTYNILPQRYYLPTGSFLTSAELFLSGSGYEDGKHYSLTGNTSLVEKATEDEFERALMLLQLSDSYVISLPTREQADTKQ